MTCIKCKGQLSEPRLLKMTGRVKGLSLEVEIEGRECTRCGHQIVAGKRTEEFMRKLADAYRIARGLLTSADIRRQRERLDMSQVEFAQHLGVGLASVKRWELGEIQTKTVDELIRLKTDTAYVEAMLEDLYQRLVSTHVGSTESPDGRARTSSTSCEQLAA